MYITIKTINNVIRKINLKDCIEIKISQKCIFIFYNDFRGAIEIISDECLNFDEIKQQLIDLK